jgi:hypothetical protein
MSDTWTDPRVELPDADITVRAIVRENSGCILYADHLAECNLTYEGDAQWRDECNNYYITTEVVVYRDLTALEAN